MVQGSSVKKKSRLTKRRMTLGAIIVAIAVCMLFSSAVIAWLAGAAFMVMVFLSISVFLPISAVLIFAGLVTIMVWAFRRRALKRVLKLIGFTLGAIALSTLLWSALCLMPRILMFLVAGLVVAYLYWPGKKRGLFLGVLGPVLALELAVLLTINLMIF